MERVGNGGADSLVQFCLNCRKAGLYRVVNLDKLTYAGNLENLRELEGDPDHVFVRGDIGDPEVLPELLRKYRPAKVFNFSA
jgi:dTDP-glucose 4,6-dehydratase